MATSKLGSAVSNLYFYPILNNKLSLLETRNVYTDLSYFVNKTNGARLWFRVHRCFGEGEEDKKKSFAGVTKTVIASNLSRGGRGEW